jgi:hypothetical protein
VVRKRKLEGFLGETEGYETIKKKVGYKKPKKKAQETRRYAVRGLFGEVVKYRTVKIRKAKKKSKTVKSKRDKKKRGRESKISQPIHKLGFCAEIQAIFQSFYKGVKVLC